MSILEKIEKVNKAIEKVKDFFDDSPLFLCLSYDLVLREKIKACLNKYALYDGVNMSDAIFNGMGWVQIEFVGKERELSNFQIVVEKTVFDYLRSGSLGYTRTKSEIQKIGESIFFVNIYYSFNKKTLNSFELYFREISNYKRQEVLDKENLIDNELEEEMKEWKI